MIATRHRNVPQHVASRFANLSFLALLAILLGCTLTYLQPLFAQGQRSAGESGREAEPAPRAEVGGAAQPLSAPQPPAAASVVVVLRFGDGSEQHFTQIAWKSGMTALDALTRAAVHPRGVPLEIRGRGRTAFVVAIDGLANQGDDGLNWIFRVNGQVGEQSAGVVEVPDGGRVEWNFEEYH